MSLSACIISLLSLVVCLLPSHRPNRCRASSVANQVAEVAGALAAGDMEGMGRLMIQSRRWAQSVVGEGGHLWPSTDSLVVAAVAAVAVADADARCLKVCRHVTT